MASDYKSVSEYLKKADEVGNRATVIRKGRFYAYQYVFNKDNSFNEIKFWDVFPLTFVFEVKGRYFWGLNFHHIPRQSRLIWLARIKKIYEMQIENDKALTSLNYSRLFSAFKKATYGIRQYRIDRVKSLKRIATPDQVDELMRIVSDTYYGVNATAVFQKYAQFKPPSKT